MSEFALGQRWVSHADVELGLGVVVELEMRRITLHFPAVAEDRTYALDRAPLTRLALKAGDTLQRIGGQHYKVLAVDDVDGLLTYAVEGNDKQREIISELEIDPHIQLSSPQDRLLNNQLDKLDDFRLRYATLNHRASTTAHTSRGLLGARTSLLSHQLYIAAEVGQRFSPRVLLADEVGLGKTIEAGLILAQQLITGRVSRVLIIVPDALIHQWLVEMLRRFNLHFSLFDKARMEESDPETPFDDQQLVLTPFSLFATSADARAQALSTDWDMVVVDEAHHLSDKDADEASLYAFVEALACATPGLLLLTATPEQAGVESHFARLKLLDPDRFSDLETFLAEQQHYGDWNELIEGLQAGRKDLVLPNDIDATLPAEGQIRQLLDRYGTGRVLFRNTRNSVPGFPARQLHSYPLTCPTLYAEHQQELYPERLCDESEWLAEDPRVAWLEQTLRELRPEKVLVIAATAETALALEHYLHLRAGIRCAAFHEGLSLVERDRAAAFFADDHGGAQALICSEIGSEGRNFQFAHHLICFDLPANPDLLEQRIGRLDRIGQQHDVTIHVPYIVGTAQEILFRWQHEGLDAFSHSCAVAHPVYRHFLTSLEQALANEHDDLEALIADTTDFRLGLEAEMQKGRDRLLELNSHGPEQGQRVIADVQAQEQPEAIESFAELLFDRIGINQSYHSDTCYVLRPTEMLITGQLPGLEEDGVTVTFDRNTALSRDDIQFLTWEHPLIREAMDIIASSELGNTAMGTLKHPKIKPGTVLLEAIHGVDCLAPASLEVGRFLDMAPMRHLISPEGRDAANAISHEALNNLLEPIATATSANVIRQIRPLLEKQLAKAEQLTEAQLTTLQSQALEKLRSDIGQERDRLVYLRSINPAVRQSEIDALEHRLEASERAIRDARIAPQALRVIIAT